MVSAFAPLRIELQCCIIQWKEKDKIRQDRKGKGREGKEYPDSLGWSRSEGYFDYLSYGFLPLYSVPNWGLGHFLWTDNPIGLWVLPISVFWSWGSTFLYSEDQARWPNLRCQPCCYNLNPNAMSICLQRTLKYCKCQAASKWRVLWSGVNKHLWTHQKAALRPVDFWTWCLDEVEGLRKKEPIPAYMTVFYSFDFK